MIEENNNTLPLVTIGVLSYNNARFIIETLDSIKAQTYSNIELIIVDDCSQDNSVELITNWLRENKYPAELIVNDKNLGICKSLNIIVSKATGKYFVPFSSDDIMLERRIEEQVLAHLKNSDEFVIIYSDAFIIDQAGNSKSGLFVQFYRRFDYLPTGNIYDFLIQGNFLPAVGLMIPIDVFYQIGFYDEKLFFEDYDLLLRMARKYKFFTHDYIGVKYRFHNENFSKKVLDWHYDYFKIYLKHVDNKIAQNKLLEIIKISYKENKEYAHEISLLYQKASYSKPIISFFIHQRIPFYFYNLFSRIYKTVRFIKF